MKHAYLLNIIKKDCLVYDIETWAETSNGTEVNIHSQFDLYIQCAKVKWFGAYSYKSDTYYVLNAQKDKALIQSLLNSHNTLIGFNSEEFDYPILLNNGFIKEDKKPIHIDLMQVLGKTTFKNRSGYPYKNRGALMGFKFANNSLRTIAETMNLETQKGEINYQIFKKDTWDFDEEMEIQTYSNGDIMTEKELFEELWKFWVPFTELLAEDYVKDFSWIRSSIASLTYKAACSYLNVKPTYADKIPEKEEMGGNVLLPTYEEATKVWYVDFASLYPHLMCMFNLLAESKLTSGEGIWHGNDVFKVRGYYDVSVRHPLNKQIANKLRERLELKKTDPKNPMVHCLKIFLNGLYGAMRSSTFEQIHTPNSGWDCCWLGQQAQDFVIKRMEEFGFEAIYGDTDSVMLMAKEENKNNREYVLECLSKIVSLINENSPFPMDTFNINIEAYVDYILFPFSNEAMDDEDGNRIKENGKLVKERKGKKKNYAYITTNKEGEKEVKLVGLPIIKDNATELGIKIYEEILKPIIIEKNRAKFTQEFIRTTINTYLQKPEIMQLISQKYKVNPLSTYKLESQIQAQISKAYFEGEAGQINLIKNRKLGKVGKGVRYCTVEEAIQNKLTADELDLKKLLNELEPFILEESKELPIKKERKKKEVNDATSI